MRAGAIGAAVRDPGFALTVACVAECSLVYPIREDV